MANFFNSKFRKFFLQAILTLVLFWPLVALAVELPNPVKNPAAAASGATVVDIVIGVFYGFLTLIAVFAFGFLVIGGFKLILSGGNPEAITAGKQSVVWSILGLAAAVLSITIILSVQTLIGGSTSNGFSNPDQLNIPLLSGGTIPSLGANGTPNSGFLGAFIQITSNIAGLAFVVCALMVVWAGYQMVFSGGNEEKITAGRTILLWALVGMGVIVLSYVIVYGVNQILVNLPNAGNFTP